MASSAKAALHSSDQGSVQEGVFPNADFGVSDPITTGIDHKGTDPPPFSDSGQLKATPSPRGVTGR